MECNERIRMWSILTLDQLKDDGDLACYQYYVPRMSERSSAMPGREVSSMTQLMIWWKM